ncbi:MAG: methylmalonyl-CoA mutase, partial [Deltaproteobacteria bacterium]|nr:methylmalonyl-CoA mutase [Deltaproteobacteria bacterium]
LRKLRKERDNEKVRQSLEKLKKVAKGDDNLYPSVLEAVESYATLGEICDTLRDVFGQYDEDIYYL